MLDKVSLQEHYERTFFELFDTLELRRVENNPDILWYHRNNQWFLYVDKLNNSVICHSTRFFYTFFIDNQMNEREAVEYLKRIFKRIFNFKLDLSRIVISHNTGVYVRDEQIHLPI